MGTRVVPLPTLVVNMSSASNSGPEAMDVSSPAASTPKQTTDVETNGKSNTRSNHSSPPDQNASATASSSNMAAPPSATASAVHQPKIVQTAFIHKLYNMLEDTSIQHLISWSSNAESFVMSPTADFSKVLSQYFKHTNISSFVRQLNMYGFHKERDVFHTGNPDTTLWEFKHGNGSFRRGDIAGLRDIKRRASRHALVHRETNFPKPSSSLPGTPAEPVQAPPESTDARLANLEHTLYEVSSRLQRSEENAHYMLVKNQALMESMGRLLNINQDLSRAMLSLAPHDSPAHRDIMALQGELQRQADVVRTMEDSLDLPYSGRQQYFGAVDNAPVSPRQLPQDDSRRPAAGLAAPAARGQPLYRPAVPSNLALGNRRPYGSIGGSSTTQSSPLRNAAAPPAAPPHPLSNVETPPGNLARRHTAADIRAHGWQPGPSPYSASNTPPAWPPSPGRVAPEDQRIRESLSSYSLQAASQSHSHSRPTTPPPHAANGSSNGQDAFGSWSWNSAASRDAKASLFKDSSAPPTRRGSMAHILNPSDTAERPDEDEDPRGEEDRKRKRMQ